MQVKTVIIGFRMYAFVLLPTTLTYRTSNQSTISSKLEKVIIPVTSNTDFLQVDHSSSTESLLFFFSSLHHHSNTSVFLLFFAYHVMVGIYLLYFHLSSFPLPSHFYLSRGIPRAVIFITFVNVELR